MPKTYSEIERNNIRRALRREGGRCLQLYGVRKTTVDELVKRAGIPKGTFYLFYPSKEALFFDILSSFMDEVETLYTEMLQEIDENHIVTSLTDIFHAIMMRFYEEGLHRFLGDTELEEVLRKLPDESLPDLRRRLHSAMETLFSYFAIDDTEDIESFSRGYEAILLLLLEAERIDEKEKTLRFLIRGLVLQMVE